MARRQITEKIVRDAAPGGKDTFIRDSKLIGFGLRITAGGVKSFIVEARVGGRPRRFTIAPVDRISVAEARGQAKELLAGNEQGPRPHGRQTGQARAL